MNTIKKALQHFEFKFKNVWKPTKPDIDAYNTIIDFVNKKHEDQINDYQLFAKLYITFYGELLKYYNSSVFDKEPQKAINATLNKPLSELINKFVEKANTQETMIKMLNSGIDIKDIRLKSIKQIEDEAENFSFDMLEPIMTYQEAEDNLTAMVNYAIDKFS